MHGVVGWMGAQHISGDSLHAELRVDAGLVEFGMQRGCALCAWLVWRLWCLLMDDMAQEPHIHLRSKAM